MASLFHGLRSNNFVCVVLLKYWQTVGGEQQWDVNDHFTISRYRSAKTLQGVNNKSINLLYYIMLCTVSLCLYVGLCLSVPPPFFFDTTVGLQPHLACELIWELFEPSQLLGGGV